jgi:rubrerythrin
MGHKLSNSKNILPVEPPCKKRIYYTPEEAQEMIKYLNENKTGKEISVYKCTVCGFWHLTSKPWK